MKAHDHLHAVLQATHGDPEARLAPHAEDIRAAIEEYDADVSRLRAVLGGLVDAFDIEDRHSSEQRIALQAALRLLEDS